MEIRYVVLAMSLVPIHVVSEWQLFSDRGGRFVRFDVLFFVSSRRRHKRSDRHWSSVVLFSYSSRRRHTRSDRDWSSDVCSSDLVCRLLLEKKNTHRSQRELLRFGRALGKILQVVGIHSHVAVVNKQLHQKSTCTGCADVPPHHP